MSLASSDQLVPHAARSRRKHSSQPVVVPGTGLVLRPMREVDLAAVTEVERAACAHPWTQGMFRDCLDAGYACWVANDGGRVLGHGVLSLVLDECHLLNLCVHPRWHRRGLGRTLLAHLLGIARGGGVVKAFLEVRVSNGPAAGLYRSVGFQTIGIRRGYYPDGATGEDALVQVLDLP